MRKLLNKFPRRIASVLLVLLFAVLPLSGCSFEGDSKQVIEKLNIVAQLTPNGDMKVKETWKINLQDRDRAYRRIYRTFEVDKEKADGISDLTVYDEDSKLQYQFIGDMKYTSDYNYAPDNSCYLHNSGNETEIGWYMPAIAKGVRTFSFTYTVKNLIDVHKDTAVLYNFFIPKKFSLPIADLSCTMTFPDGGDKSALRAWLHSDAKGNLTIDSSNQVSFTAKEIPAETSVEVRLCMPPQLFPLR